LENLIRRLTVLAVDDMIPADMIEAELNSRSEDASPVGDANAANSLGAAVQVQLERYFNRHGDTLPPPGLYDRVLREVELPLIALTLATTRGNQLKAADLLGINRNTLRKKIRELDIPVTRGKKLM
jgi:two-component system nitrogen regulation response regulator GlnG